MIHLQEATVQFPGVIPVKALTNIDLQVDRGDWISVLGPSGSGKTTLLNIIGGMEQLSHGSATVNGKELSQITGQELQVFRRETIGFVFQHYRLFDQYTVLENVMLPQWPYQPRKRIEKKAKDLLEQLQMGHRLNHVPNQLSGGEKQRTAIARALLNDPELLLCDEPTGNLDANNRENIMQLLQQLHLDRDMTIILVTHDDQVATYGNRTLELRDGQLMSEIYS